MIVSLYILSVCVLILGFWVVLLITSENKTIAVKDRTIRDQKRELQRLSDELQFGRAMNVEKPEDELDNR